MKKKILNHLKLRSVFSTLIGLTAAAALVLPANVRAIEDPPGCSPSSGSGGLGNTSSGGIDFNFSQAHIGDTVQVLPRLGMVANACRAINATGAVYIATGPLTNFLINVTLDPGVLISCPANGLCQPGPYNVTLTAPLVGASVTSPNGSIPGVAKNV